MLVSVVAFSQRERCLASLVVALLVTLLAVLARPMPPRSATYLTAAVAPATASAAPPAVFSQKGRTVIVTGSSKGSASLALSNWPLQIPLRKPTASKAAA